MKSVITILFLLLATISFAQPQNFNDSEPLQITKFSDFKISMTVDSASDIESTFKLKDIKDVLNDVSEDENISFEIICNGNQISKGEKSKVSYKVKGNTNNLKPFLKTIKKIRKGAINYYKNK
ncbi:hypothetical protein [Psychroserpens ponticola]|uniref:Uncharacterized protein n=1 Tax=Psychroserpens ponticola TaxID=2932268 RepID=A0ABY7RY94_9FLAO|nr:hypothetical protein [Psychroserpens ponticola]WCO02123.1 hypothetical protein MUN68_001235 [Psychroserpens ponticola]